MDCICSLNWDHGEEVLLVHDISPVPDMVRVEVTSLNVHARLSPQIPESAKAPTLNAMINANNNFIIVEFLRFSTSNNNKTKRSINHSKKSEKKVLKVQYVIKNDKW